MPIDIKPWQRASYPWGEAIKYRRGNWETLILKPDAQEIDVSNLNIILHENGIEILGVKDEYKM